MVKMSFVSLLDTVNMEMVDVVTMQLGRLSFDWWNGILYQ